MSAVQSDALQGGFENAPLDSATAIRAIMNALARPGEIETLEGARPPLPLSVAAGPFILTLCDPDTPIHLAGRHDCPDVRDWITFHTGAPFNGRQNASFALGDWGSLLPLEPYPIGTAEYPDRSATLVVELEKLEGSGVTLTGPGIKDHSAISLPELNHFVQNTQAFPLGLDFFFTCANQLSGLPRTTKVEAA